MLVPDPSTHTLPPRTCSREAVVLEARRRADALAEQHPAAAQALRSLANALIWGDIGDDAAQKEGSCTGTP